MSAHGTCGAAAVSEGPDGTPSFVCCNRAPHDDDLHWTISLWDPNHRPVSPVALDDLDDVLVWSEVWSAS